MYKHPMPKRRIPRLVTTSKILRSCLKFLSDKHRNRAALDRGWRGRVDTGHFIHMRTASKQHTIGQYFNDKVISSQVGVPV